MASFTVVATSEEFTDLASITLTRDELASGLETRKCIIWVLLEQLLSGVRYGKLSEITKTFTSAAGVPALKLLFLVTKIPPGEHIKDRENETSEIGKLKLQL